MATFAVSGATLGVARPSSARSAAERRDSPPALLFRKKDSSSRGVLSCAGAAGKVLVPGSGSDDLLTSAEPAAAGPTQTEESQIPEDVKEQTAEANTSGGAEDKPESSEPTKGIVKTVADGVTKGVKELVVEEKPRVIPKPGDGQKIYKIDPMLEDFRSHLDYRYSEYKRIRAAIDQHEGGLDAFSRGYEKLGFTRRDGHVHLYSR